MSEQECVRVDIMGNIEHLRRVIRLFLMLLASFSLLVSPAAGAASAALAATPSECSMSGAELAIATGHEHMPCCTPECTAPAAAAVLAPSDLGTSASAEPEPRLLLPRYFMLPSVNPAATDPPPRLHLA